MAADRSVQSFNSSDGLVMTPKERASSSILIVEPDALERNNMRAAIRSLGYGDVGDAPNHVTGLERLGQRKFTHIIFDAKPTNMPPVDFVIRALEGCAERCCIPASFEPNIDDVFDMLIKGAKGYLCKPFTTDSLDAAIVNATKGEPISEVVMQATDRNEALVAIVMQTLDKAALVMRQAQQFETAKREVPRAFAALRRAADLAYTFAKDGENGLMEALEKFCIERSKGPATKLGRLRKRLQNKRGDEEEEPQGEQQ